MDGMKTMRDACNSAPDELALDLLEKDKPHIAFTSKADTLAALQEYPDLHIPSFLAFTQGEWKENTKQTIDRIRKELGRDIKLAVRSSSRKEDSTDSSGAGKFLSVLDVNVNSENSLKEAIEQVFKSYGEASPDDQVLIQHMIPNPEVTGVIMTRVLADGSPYYVINYDDESGRTDSITGGNGKVSKTVYVYRGAREQDFDSPRLRSFVNLARRVEEICGLQTLDIEFCLDKDKTLRLLQARPIAASKNWPDNNVLVHEFIGQVAEFIDDRTGPAPDLFSRRSILGVMPDWNPAEMIGILPRPLAASLYRNLITSSVWRKARAVMGYREVSGAELMLMVLGRPYIDVRASFNSFLPAGLDDLTSEALVSAWLDRLENNPHLHDKVEFEVAQTILDFCFDSNMDERYPGLLTGNRRKDFRERLLALTRKNLDISRNGSLNQAMERVTELRVRQAGRPLPGPHDTLSISSLGPLLAECRDYGSLPFSILARHAFIAESLLRTSVKRGALGQDRLAAFKLSLRTISGELSTDFLEVCAGRKESRSFLQKYGHLRPGSYDILSPRYADRHDLFIGGIPLAEQEMEPFSLSPREKADIAKLLDESGLSITPEGLLQYASRAIAGRELAKFIFTRNLSDALETIAGWGATLGFGREDLSYIDVEAILDQTIQVLPESPKSRFAGLVEINKRLLAQSGLLKLGYLIRSERDVYIAPQHRAAPNFVGAGMIEADVIRLAADSACDAALSGKIVCIENADPGFDWIFTRNIGGLITKFGGANSHMTIRCAEYDLPAAIGVGSQIFDSVASSERALLNPSAAIVKAM